MKKGNKKGFTLVELIIVIAVIAILAAVLVPTFSNIIRKANIASDITVVKNINTALAIREDQTKVKTMYEALNVAEDCGFIIDRLTPTTANADILWDSVSQYFMLVDNQGGQIKTLYKESETADIIATNDATNNQHKYWKIIQKVQNNGDYSNEKYSLAINDNNFKGEVKVGAGFDVLDTKGVTSVKYENIDSTQKDIVIRTNTFGTKVTVIGTDDDTVTHYGFAGLVDVQRVKMSSYDEFGIIGRLSATGVGATGHIDIKAGAIVYQVEQLGGASTSVTVDKDATVYDINHEIITEKITNDSERFTIDSKDGFVVTETHSTDGGERITAQECVHEHSEDVIDGQHVYEVCKTCGYTVIKVDSDKKTVATSNNENVIIPKAAYDGSQVTVGDTNGDVKINTKPDGSYVTPSIEETPVISFDNSLNLNCSHEWEEIEILPTCTDTGSKEKFCGKCGLSYISQYYALGHNWVAYSSDNANYSTKHYCSRLGCGQVEDHSLRQFDGDCSVCGYCCNPTEHVAHVIGSVTDYHYTNLNDAIGVANATGSVVQLLQDVDMGTTSIIIETNKTRIIDLNGHSITTSYIGSGAGIHVKQGANLSIIDNSANHLGKIIGSSTCQQLIRTYGELSMNNIAIEYSGEYNTNSSYMMQLYGATSIGNVGIVVNSSSKVTALIANSATLNIGTGTTITDNRNNSNCKYVIGNLSGDNPVNITGGSITTKYTVFNACPATISGGIFTTTGTMFFDGLTIITGGTFTYNTLEDSSNEFIIKGGKYSKSVADYMVTDITSETLTSGYYVVSYNSNNIACYVGNYFYGSLATAISQVGNTGGTIKLAKDCAESVEIDASRDFIINVNGFTFTDNITVTSACTKTVTDKHYVIVKTVAENVDETVSGAEELQDVFNEIITGTGTGIIRLSYDSDGSDALNIDDSCTNKTITITFVNTYSSGYYYWVNLQLYVPKTATVTFNGDVLLSPNPSYYFPTVFCDIQPYVEEAVANDGDTIEYVLIIQLAN